METFHLKIVLKLSVQPSLQENVIKHLLFSLKALAKFYLKIHYTLSPHTFQMNALFISILLKNIHKYPSLAVTPDCGAHVWVQSQTCFEPLHSPVGP